MARSRLVGGLGVRSLVVNSKADDTIEVGRRLRQLASIGVEVLDGVGAKKLAALREQGIDSVLDLLTTFPRRYIDRTAQKPIRDMLPGDEALVLATVKRSEARRSRQGRTFVEVDVFDGSGYLKATFFNQPWRAKQLPAGTEVAMFGKLDIFNGQRRMTNPVVDLVGGDKTGKIVPLYPQSEKSGLTTGEMAGWVGEALRRAGRFADPLPRRFRDELDLVGRDWAMHQIHEPEAIGSTHAARKRLAFDELLRLQLVLVIRKRAVERDSIGIVHPSAALEGHGPFASAFHASLPFPLTGAQRRANTEIACDLASPLPMHRLLQGDVGSGKTLVAVTAALMAIQDGHQAALMAPTEVLAEQHFIGIRSVLDAAELTVREEGSLTGERPVTVKLLTNRTTAAERRDLFGALKNGTVDFLIGTHALIG